MKRKVAIYCTKDGQLNNKTAEILREQGNDVAIYCGLNRCKLAAALRKDRPSIVHAIGEDAYLQAVSVCNRLKLPLAITVTSNFEHTRLLKKHCAKGNCILAETDEIRNRLIALSICNSKRVFLAEEPNFAPVYSANINVVRPLDYMISGYYGRNNFGDNLTLNRLMDHLQDYRGSVLTCDFSNTDVPPKVKLIHRFDLLKICKTMKKTKVFLFGSGSILQDATSNRSIFYYYFIMKMAIHYHCKTMLYANGIGPINNPKNRKNIARILKKIDLITIRDQDSIDLMHQLHPGKEAFLTQDDAFSYNVEQVVPFPLDRQAEGKTVVGVNFKLNGKDQDRIEDLAAALRYLADKHQLYYLLIPYHLSQDLAPMQQLKKMLPDCSELSNASYDPDRLIRYAANCEFQIVERLHGQIVSSMLGQPFLPINYDPKTKAFSAQTKMFPYLVHHEDLSKQALIQAFEHVLKDREEIEKQLSAFHSKAKKEAAKNRAHLYQIIKNF